MTTSLILKQTVRALLANPPVYFLCTISVAAACLLIAGLMPAFQGPTATQVVHAITVLLMAMAILPYLAIVAWYTACHRDNRPTRLREAFRSIEQNVLSLFALAAFLGFGLYLPGALRALPLPAPISMSLPIIAALILLRFSLAFPIALLERRSPLASLAASWRRMRGHYLTALGLSLCYLLAAAAIILLVLPLMTHLAPWKNLLAGVILYALGQVLWTVSFTCLYVHATPVHEHFADDANTYPPPLEDLPNDRTDMHDGEPHALADFGEPADLVDTPRG